MNVAGYSDCNRALRWEEVLSLRSTIVLIVQSTQDAALEPSLCQVAASASPSKSAAAKE